MSRYNYIIAGAGCAGLSLLVRLINDGQTAGKRILLVDKGPKDQNDRTWCFWEKETGLFDSIVHHSWNHLWFHSEGFSRKMDISPYRYKMIRGLDFYQYCFSLLRAHPEIEVRFGHINSMDTRADGAVMDLDGEWLEADYIFNSIFHPPRPASLKEYYLLQHFKGWIIQTPEPVFKPEEATLMDFRVSQAEGATFVYVLPLSPHEALVEYTLFSSNLLKPEAYNTALEDYISNYPGIGAYTVKEEEFGIIPMTNHRFPRYNGRLVYIGMAGGQTKPSSGYTFRYIQKHSRLLAGALAQTGRPYIKSPWLQKRFHLYDSTLLHILHHRKMEGSEIFAQLFKKNEPAKVLRFLDNETSIGQELLLMQSLPKMVFLPAALRQL